MPDRSRKRREAGRKERRGKGKGMKGWKERKESEVKIRGKNETIMGGALLGMRRKQKKSNCLARAIAEIILFTSAQPNV